jgi:hypothetical protein
MADATVPVSAARYASPPVYTPPTLRGDYWMLDLETATGSQR